MRAVRLATASGLAAGAAAFAAPGAGAVITITPGADTVSTPRLELDFGDTNPERVTSLKWRDSNGTVGGNLAVSDMAGGCDGPLEDTQNFWGMGGSAAGPPQPVGDGNEGTWTPRGGRTVDIATTRKAMCFGDATVTPVRTRYTFFNVGDAASKVRVERRFSFSAANPGAFGAASMRAYVPRMPASPYSIVIFPLTNNSLAILPAGATTQGANWNGTWFALDDPGSRSGVVVLRETSNAATLTVEQENNANVSSADLLKPGGAWNAPLTETEWLCFYDAASWPPASRTSGNSLPSGCSVVPVPINTAAPAISGTPKGGSPSRIAESILP